MNKIIIFILICSLFFACSQPSLEKQSSTSIDPSNVLTDTATSLTNTICEQEKTFTKYNLVNLKLLDSNIVVSLTYSDTANFLHYDAYGCITNAYLQQEVAQKLLIAQKELRNIKPHYNLIVFDAARPIQIQQRMWDSIKLPLVEKTKYLSNPNQGSLHNYGAAVDVSIVDSAGKELDMATPFDFFGDKAQPIKEPELLKSGVITLKQVQNRQLLRSVMYKAGFFNIQTEWWHFNACNRYTAQSKYKLIQ